MPVDACSGRDAGPASHYLGVGTVLSWPALTLALVSVSVAVLPGCSTDSRRDRVVISPAAARAVVQSYWPKREAAIAAGDVTRIKALESGAAGQVDGAVAEDEHARSPWPGSARVRTHKEVMVFVPRQTTYPATFLAEVITETYESREPFKEIMVFIKSSADMPWQLTLDVGGSTIGVDPAGVDNRFDPAPPRLAGVDPSAFPGKLASYWQACWVTGRAPIGNGNDFLPGYWTTQKCNAIAGSSPGRFDPTCGCIPRLSYSSNSATGEFSFNTHSGSLLSCFAIRIDDQSRALPHAVLLQDDGRNHWGGKLPPGTYSEIDQTSLRQVCVFTGPQQRDLLDVLGGTDAFIKITGIPARTQAQQRQND